MKKTERIIQKVKNDKELLKAIDKAFYGEIDEKIQYFIDHVNSYIKAIKEKRMFCIIHSVSSSGMSRTLTFQSCEKGKNGFWFRNYYSLFNVLGFVYVKNVDAFRISGCGMNMIFATNYENIQRFYNLGFISKKQSENLCQTTPTTF